MPAKARDVSKPLQTVWRFLDQFPHPPRPRQNTGQNWIYKIGLGARSKRSKP